MDAAPVSAFVGSKFVLLPEGEGLHRCCPCQLRLDVAVLPASGMLA
jgi:hypothetical protein